MAKKDPAEDKKVREAEEKKKAEESANLEENNQSEVEETVKVELKANIKYNTERFKKGQKIEIKKSDYDSFLKEGLINEK
ncbi:hypothetical protein NST77_23185 [Niallia sp. FSL W8-0177]|uniref:DUF7210 family protein n=1 Tax=Niallia TaxID=2837506 RepID=UPI002E1B2E71|nr:hypothetical protein [Niallia circulans]